MSLFNTNRPAAAPVLAAPPPAAPAAGTNTGLFAGVENAQSFSSGAYIPEGVYEDVEILAIKPIITRKKERAVVVECQIIADGKGPGAMPAGSKGSAMYMLRYDSFLANMRDIAQACASEMFVGVLDEKTGKLKFPDGVPLSEIDEETCDSMCSPDQPFRGVHLRVQATTIKTKAGNPFTRYDWEPKSIKIKKK